MEEFNQEVIAHEKTMKQQIGPTRSEGKNLTIPPLEVEEESACCQRGTVTKSQLK